MTGRHARDVDDTTGCALDERCEQCGSGDEDDLAVATAGTPVGVYCLTLCGPCADAGRVPEPGGWSAAVTRVLAHCGHLGIDADQMAAQLERAPTPTDPAGTGATTDSARPGGHHPCTTDPSTTDSKE